MWFTKGHRNDPFQSPIQAHSSGLHALRFLFAWSVCPSWLAHILAPFFALSNLPPGTYVGSILENIYTTPTASVADDDLSIPSPV